MNPINFSNKNFDDMGISWAHSKGYLGNNVTVLVKEFGVDNLHPALKKAVLPSSYLGPQLEIEHGTHICGIIAAELNEVESQMGAAPLAKIQMLYSQADFKEDEIVDIDIVNWSGGFNNPLIQLFQKNPLEALTLLCSNQKLRPFSRILRAILEIENEFEREQQLKIECDKLENLFQHRIGQIFHNKLVLVALGNEAANMSESSNLIESDGAHLKNVNWRNHSIQVMSVEDSLLPSEFSNRPGASFAHETICAKGSNVSSTVPNGKYRQLQGTSMATAFATAVAALVKAAHPSLTSLQIRYCILEGARPILLVNNIPILLKNQAALSNYPPKVVKDSQNVFGKGLLSAKGAIKVGNKL